MSYDIELQDPVSGEPLKLGKPHHMRGGVIEVGGATYAELNVTYNYSAHFRRVIDREKGIRRIYGMTGAASIPILEEGIASLLDDPSDDYWEATEGNAKRALTHLLELARMCPDGVWSGD